MITQNLKAGTIELAEPALDGHFPVRVQVEESADNPHPYPLAGSRWRRQRRRRILPFDDARYQAAIKRLQVAIVAPLISEKEWLLVRDHFLDTVQCSGFDVGAQRIQLSFVGSAPATDFVFIVINDRQFRKTGSETGVGISRPERQRAFEIRRCLIVAVELDQHAATNVMGLGIVGPSRQRCFQMRQRLVKSVEQEQCPTVIVACFREVRIDGKSALVACQRFLGPTECYQQEAALIVRFDVFRFQCQRALDGFHRFVVAAEREQRGAPVVMRLGKIGLDGGCLAVGVDGFLVAAKRRQRNTTVVVCLGKFRFQLDRLLEAIERVFGPREGIKNEASV